MHALRCDTVRFAANISLNERRTVGCERVVIHRTVNSTKLRLDGRLRIDLERRTDHQEHVDEPVTSARPCAIQGDGNGPHAVIDYLHQSREAR